MKGGGLAISKNLSLEGGHFQAFLMERVPVVSNLQVPLNLIFEFSYSNVTQPLKISHF